MEVDAFYWHGSGKVIHMNLSQDYVRMIAEKAET